MLTEKYLIEKFVENKFKPLEVVCPDNTKVIIKPCGYDINSISDVEYYLVEGDLPWLGGDNLTKIVEQLYNHEQLVLESDKEKEELKKYFEEYSKQGWPEDTFSYYSDWHKDLYGFRPSKTEEPGLYVNPEDR